MVNPKPLTCGSSIAPCSVLLKKNKKLNGDNAPRDKKAINLTGCGNKKTRIGQFGNRRDPLRFTQISMQMSSQSKLFVRFSCGFRGT